jgi:hypothetical protein
MHFIARDKVQGNIRFGHKLHRDETQEESPSMITEHPPCRHSFAPAAAKLETLLRIVTNSLKPHN